MQATKPLWREECIRMKQPCQQHPSCSIRGKSIIYDASDCWATGHWWIRACITCTTGNEWQSPQASWNLYFSVSFECFSEPISTGTATIKMNVSLWYSIKLHSPAAIDSGWKALGSSGFSECGIMFEFLDTSTATGPIADIDSDYFGGHHSCARYNHKTLQVCIEVTIRDDFDNECVQI